MLAMHVTLHIGRRRQSTPQFCSIYHLLVLWSSPFANFITTSCIYIYIITVLWHRVVFKFPLSPRESPRTTQYCFLKDSERVYKIQFVIGRLYSYSCWCQCKVPLFQCSQDAWCQASFMMQLDELLKARAENFTEGTHDTQKKGDEMDELWWIWMKLVHSRCSF